MSTCDGWLASARISGSSAGTLFCKRLPLIIG